MMPVGAPTTRFSASWPILTSSGLPSPTSQRSFRARATAHSIAAEEDSPAPAGTSEVSARSRPDIRGGTPEPDATPEPAAEPAATPEPAAEPDAVPPAAARAMAQATPRGYA